MARYIDADKLIAHLKDEIEGCKPPFGGRANGKSIAYGTELGLKSAISFAETLPTADVVEVVRCKDCKYFLDEDEFDSLGMCLCERIARNYGGEIYPERIHFCNYGERKD